MSSNSPEQPADFESVKNRLAEIADAVDDEALSLDDALDLYEEAVALGLKASDLLEVGIVVPEEEAPAEGEPAAADAQPAEPAEPAEPASEEAPADAEPSTVTDQV